MNVLNKLSLIVLSSMIATTALAQGSPFYDSIIEKVEKVETLTSACIDQNSTTIGMEGCLQEAQQEYSGLLNLVYANVGGDKNIKKDSPMSQASLLASADMWEPLVIEECRWRNIFGNGSASKGFLLSCENNMKKERIKEIMDRFYKEI